MSRSNLSSPPARTGLWQPLSMLVFEPGGALASEFMLRRLLSRNDDVRLRYLGDRMWPAIGHGAEIRVGARTKTRFRPGDLVIAAPEGIPDLLRIDSVIGTQLRLGGDGDPWYQAEIPAGEVIGAVHGEARPISLLQRRINRWRLDLREAMKNTSEETSDAAETVLRKYDAQAPHYVRSDPPALPENLLDGMKPHLTPGSTVLVVGSGTGRDCLALARLGVRAVGVDFSAEMVRLAARGREVPDSVAYLRADIRNIAFPPGSFRLIYFTPDVYSFIPFAGARQKVLRSMASWLTADGALLLSARAALGAYDRFLLTLQWFASHSDRRRGWGSSHTRWIDARGATCRSFVHVFTPASLVREVQAAGWVPAGTAGPWLVLRTG